MREVKVTIYFGWDNEEGSVWHCGSLSGAKRFVADKVSQGYVQAYSIEVINWIPVDEDDPEGQLYGGFEYIDYQEVGKQQAEQ